MCFVRNGGIIDVFEVNLFIEFIYYEFINLGWLWNV